MKAAALGLALMLGGCASTQVLRDFTTDGCSLFPDGDAQDAVLWRECCVTHDQAYWRGGSADARKNADAAFRTCVLERSGRPGLAGQMYHGVRLGGTPWLPTWFRWGYGWGYGRGYAPLTPDEQQHADDKLAANWPELSCEPDFLTWHLNAINSVPEIPALEQPSTSAIDGSIRQR